MTEPRAIAPFARRATPRAPIATNGANKRSSTRAVRKDKIYIERLYQTIPFTTIRK